jgi:transcription termination/antitermination protein NusA
MLNIKELTKALKQVADEKGLDPEKVLDVIESSIAAAYKREYGDRNEVVKCKLDQKTGELQFWQIKTVVDDTMVRFVTEEEDVTNESVAAESSGTEKKEVATAENAEDEEQKLPRFNPDRHITIEDAKKTKKDVVLGEEMAFPLETHDDFGRIAAQTAKQVILQKLRESERDSILGEWRGREGQIVSGVIQRFERGNIFVDLGRTIGVMFGNESIPGEHYRAGERLRFLVIAVQEDTRLPGIILSRSHPKFVVELFRMEVPELVEDAIEVKAIAREPGNRTKIAAVSKIDGIDPVGALVGQRGTRVMAVNNELGNEKIDIVEWSDDPERLIANALSPAKVERVEIMQRHEARAYVPESQLSLAIGKGGQNVRLAAKLTGWKIDVRSQANPEEVQEGGVSEGPVEGDQIEKPKEDDEHEDIAM